MTVSTPSAPTATPGLERAFQSVPRFRHEPYVVAAILEFGRALESGRLAPSQTAETLLRRNPFALLLAILLDQGVPAERAFQAPQTLHERLGHLDPARMAGDEPGVLRAMSARPMPHRFPAVGTRWIVRAASRVSDELDGDVRRLWADRPTARALQARFEAFDGIGQKKAAMAVEILARDFAVPLDEMSGSDVAVDVHVRRVFLRTGLSASDSIEDIVRAARELHPLRPGELDVPVWMIGRNWCRPRSPKCSACPISWACPSSTAYPQSAENLVSLRAPATLAAGKRAPVARVGAGEDVSGNP